MHTYMDGFMHACVRACKKAYQHARVLACACDGVCVCIRVHVYSCMRACVYVRMRVHVQM